jgi:AacA4 family aminoglycoside N(6')-acetyltransferase
MESATPEGSTNGPPMTHAKQGPVLAAVPGVTLRPMTEADLGMLHEWLNRPHIVEWWGGEEARPSLEEVRQHYRPSVLAREGVTPYIAMSGTEPIGYAQSYVAMGSGEGWWEEVTDPGVRGIDQSLANAADLGRGLGTALVRALVSHLFSDPTATRIQTDPSPHNHRATRCYEKAGFVQQGVITTPDGPAMYMVQTREAYEAARRVVEPCRVHCAACMPVTAPPASPSAVRCRAVASPRAPGRAGR